MGNIIAAFKKYTSTPSNVCDIAETDTAIADINVTELTSDNESTVAEIEVVVEIVDVVQPEEVFDSSDEDASTDEEDVSTDEEVSNDDEVVSADDEVVSTDDEVVSADDEEVVPW
jgi:hypothetical protein